jgi:hypothetical protein
MSRFGCVHVFRLLPLNAVSEPDSPTTVALRRNTVASPRRTGACRTLAVRGPHSVPGRLVPSARTHRPTGEVPTAVLDSIAKAAAGGRRYPRRSPTHPDRCLAVQQLECGRGMQNEASMASVRAWRADGDDRSVLERKRNVSEPVHVRQLETPDEGARRVRIAFDVAKTPGGACDRAAQRA